MESRIPNIMKRRRTRRENAEGPAPEPADAGVQAATDALYRWPSFGPPGYLGQLTDEYQRALADERSGLTRAECSFYHTVELPGGEIVTGPWDLRGHEAEYIGNVELAGRRVLELGPATGHMTYFMERAGAQVVAFDAGYDVSIDLHPPPGNVDTRKLRLDHARMINEVQNSWWYLHRAYDSSAQMVYGNIYALPPDLGEFDVSVFAAILLHLHDPISALEQAARRTRDMIVVTEPWALGSDSLLDNIMQIFPYGDSGRWTLWWSISAGAVIRILETLGFRRTRVVEHTQKHQFGHKAAAEYDAMKMYTVIAERG